MPILTDAQIAGLAKGVGLSGDALVKAVAIALAESNGKTDVLGPPTSWGRAVGVWQIMPMAGRPATAQLKDPNVNAQQMYKISSGGKNWKPWEAYTNGRYFAYLPRARKAAGNPDTSSGGSNGSGVQQVGLISGLDSISAFFEFISDPNTWMRLGMILGGAGLVGFALFQISGQGSKIVSAVNTATNVLPQTRAVKGAANAVKAAA